MTHTGAAQPPARPVAATLAAFASEILKTTTLRGWWIGTGVVLAMTIFYAHSGVQSAAKSVTTLDAGRVVDFDGAVRPIEHVITNAVVGPVYQSALLVVPLLSAVACSQEHRTGQALTSATAVPNRLRLSSAQIASVGTMSAVIAVVLSLTATAVALLGLPPEVHPLVLSASTGPTIARMTMFTVTLALIGGALTHLFRNQVPALVGVLVLLLLSLAPPVHALAPALHGLLPAVTAQTFLFGNYSGVGQPTATAGAVVLLGWMLVSAMAWLLACRVREVA